MINVLVRKALQELLDTCHEYATEFNLKFSTDPNPVKSKTKCLLFSNKKLTIEKMNLGENKLPWVEKGKHLGNTLQNIIDGIRKELSISIEIVNCVRNFISVHQTLSLRSIRSTTLTLQDPHFGTSSIMRLKKMKILGVYPSG